MSDVAAVRKKIMLVDDNSRFRSGTRMILEMNGFDVLEAVNGSHALTLLEEQVPDLIISDIMMPEINGYDLLRRTQSNPDYLQVPFLFLTALDDEAAIDQATQMQVDSYLTKPVSPKKLVQAVHSRLDRIQSLQNTFITRSYRDALSAMAIAIEARDAQTGGHIKRVASSAGRLARALGWSDITVSEVELAAELHDIGKVIVPDNILNKPSSLTRSEWELMKKHPQEGVRILQPLQHIQILIDGVRHHHERYDGSGYPDGLAGKAIPAVGRLLAVVDAFDAMISERPYQKGIPVEPALARLQEQAGRQFDPDMVITFVNMWRNKT